MAIGCNIWMICLKLNWYFYGLSRMFQLPQFVWALRSSVWDVFINILLIDAIDRSKISSDQKRFFIALSLHPLLFFVNTPFKESGFFSVIISSSKKLPNNFFFNIFVRWNRLTYSTRMETRFSWVITSLLT